MMRLSIEESARRRRQIVEVAAKLFREHGYNGIGVADLMKGAGLTHGGFYGYFESKEQLFAESCGHAIETSVQQWQSWIRRDPGDPVRELAHSYLNEAHRDTLAAGCVISSLGADAARGGQHVRRALTGGISAQLRLLAKTLPGPASRARKRAIATYAAIIGGLMLARAVDDRGLSKEILAATAAQLNSE